MRLAAILGLTVGLLAMPATSGARSWAKRQIKAAVADDCQGQRLECRGWRVRNCVRQSRRAVRCSAMQRYGRRQQTRRCYFPVSLRPIRSRPDYYRVRFGFTRCYRRDGTLIPPGR